MSVNPSTIHHYVIAIWLYVYTYCFCIPECSNIVLSTCEKFCSTDTLIHRTNTFSVILLLQLNRPARNSFMKPFRQEF